MVNIKKKLPESNSKMQLMRLIINGWNASKYGIIDNHLKSCKYIESVTRLNLQTKNPEFIFWCKCCKVHQKLWNLYCQIDSEGFVIFLGLLSIKTFLQVLKKFRATATATLICVLP